MECNNCKKQIDDDSEYCMYCGKHLTKTKDQDKKDEKKQEEKPVIKEHRKSSKLLHKIKQTLTNKAYIFIIIILVLFSALVFLLMTGKTIYLDINLQFDIFPRNYSKANIFAVNFEDPLSEQDLKLLEQTINITSQHNIPLTIFMTARKLDNLTDFKKYLNETPKLDTNISEIKEIAKKYNAKIDIQSSGYIDIPYSDLPYEYQEKFIIQSRKAFKDQGVLIKGLSVPKNQVSYDTLLAAENNKIEYITLQSKENIPAHPDSMLGGKMNIIVFPITAGVKQGQAKRGVYVQYIDISKMKDSFVRESLGKYFEEIKNKPGTIFPSFTEMNNYIRQTEKMSATLTTNYKEMISGIQFDELINNTKVIIKTELIPINITDLATNATFNWQYVHYYDNVNITNNTISLILNSTNENIQINWHEIE